MIFFVVNRDKKVTIHDKKNTNRDFFLSLGMALNPEHGQSVIGAEGPVLIPSTYCENNSLAELS